jgi:hypothetical protein
MVYCPGTDGDVFDVFGLFETQPKENDLMPTAAAIWELIERTRCASCGMMLVRGRGCAINHGANGKSAPKSVNFMA